MKIKFKHRPMLGVILMGKFSGKRLEAVSDFRKIYGKQLEEELTKDREFLNKVADKDKEGNWKRNKHNEIIIKAQFKKEFEEQTKKRAEEDYIEINDKSAKEIEKIVKEKIESLSKGKEEMTIDEYEALKDLQETFKK